jgi:cell division protein FtsB
MVTRRKAAETPVRRLLRRAAWAAGAIALAWFAVEGGEYGTRDLLRAHARRDAAEAQVAALRAEVESLKVELRAVESDPVRLEQIARESFGMVKGDRELVYTVRRRGRQGAPADSATTTGGVDLAEPPDTFI